jgi:mannose/fructose/N-acetylgalactosamine-specific phosphotransferase system component IID
MWRFFLVFNLIIIIIHLLLVYYDYRQTKSMIISLRSGAMAYILGMGFVVIRMGLLSFAFIILFCAAQAIHFLIFWSATKMPNDIVRRG